MLWRHLIVTTCVLLGAMVAGCGEREQTALYKDGKYRGKPDGRPWDSQPLPYGSEQWSKGDRGSWENQVRARSQGQNENSRIVH